MRVLWLPREHKEELLEDRPAGLIYVEWVEKLELDKAKEQIATLKSRLAHEKSLSSDLICNRGKLVAALRDALLIGDLGKDLENLKQWEVLLKILKENGG